MRSLYLLLSLLLAFFAAPLQAQNVTAKTNGGVACQVKECSQIGIDLMKKGGNAADAMVGTVICVGTIAMYHTGIGGGGFMLVRSPQGGYEFIDFREMAPAASNQNMFNITPDLSVFGGMASGVPGELKGLEYLHTKYGNLTWKETIMPSVRIARNGFRVDADHVRLFGIAQEYAGRNFLTDDPTWALDFAPNGTLVGLGDIMYRKRYADTLETIANRGAKAFYEGVIANLTIKGLNATGGIMTVQDMKNYSIAIRNPVFTTYRDYRLWSTSAPSSGAVVQAALRILEGYEIIDSEIPVLGNLSTHLIVEAMRFGYAMRTELGDPQYAEGVDEFQVSMLSEASAERIREKISFERTLNVSEYNPKGWEVQDTPGTSHFSAADKSGLAISLTSTVNLLFGSTVMIPETGVIMNNQMNDFSIPTANNSFGFVPSPANFIKPFKRPLSSISATIIEDPNGRLYLVVGAAGGSRIISATIQNIINVIDGGDSAYQALARTRLHDQLQPNECSIERDFNNATADFLRSLGHNVTYNGPIGESIAQAVRLLPNGTFEAAGEPRLFSGEGGIAF